MPAQIINMKKLNRDLSKITEKLQKIEDIATTRALNEIVRREEKAIAADVSKEYGITQKAARKRTKLTKATKFNKTVALKFRSTRINLLKARQLKSGGISFQAKGRRRVKITTSINGGTKPFMINAKAGGQAGGDNIKVPGGNKRIPVYREKGMRKVTTLKGSSIAHMVESLQIDDKRLMKRINEELPGVYKNKLKSARKGF